MVEREKDEFNAFGKGVAKWWWLRVTAEDGEDLVATVYGVRWLPVADGVVFPAGNGRRWLWWSFWHVEVLRNEEDDGNVHDGTRRWERT
ncbi:hypothetical protein L1987_19043 [Smallanthus sonchifolius]|uniref:Uncharacterized protein n=1 Tax=Smallanthus sonchifolius TaxID=185202 RepID=A0ACB9J2F0_9ASTR|nr:hypothetical protein L1987_19043 [Smallanthus sonchifolius]